MRVEDLYRVLEDDTQLRLEQVDQYGAVTFKLECEAKNIPIYLIDTYVESVKAITLGAGGCCCSAILITLRS